MWCGSIGIRKGDGIDEGVVVLGSEEVTGQMKVWSSGIGIRRGDRTD